MIRLCSTERLESIRADARGVTFAFIMLDEGAVTAALVSADHLGHDVPMHHVHVMRHCAVDTGARRDQMPSMDQLQKALYACLESAHIADWRYSLLVLSLPFSASHLIEFDERIQLDGPPLLNRFRDRSVHLARKALHRHIPTPYIATDLGERVFITDADLHVPDPRGHPTQHLDFKGTLVLSARSFCNGVRALLAPCGLEPHLIIAAPLTLRGFLKPSERRAGRSAVLYLNRFAVRAAIFEAGGLRHLGHLPTGTEALIDAARRHNRDLTDTHVAAWSTARRPLDEAPTPDLALAISALDEACQTQARDIANWFDSFASAAENKDSRPLDTVHVVSDTPPLTTAFVRIASSRQPAIEWDPVSRPTSVVDFTTTPVHALRVRALAQELCARLEDADPLDFEAEPSAQALIRDHLLSLLGNGCSRIAEATPPALQAIADFCQRIATALRDLVQRLAQARAPTIPPESAPLDPDPTPAPAGPPPNAMGL